MSSYHNDTNLQTILSKRTLIEFRFFLWDVEKLTFIIRNVKLYYNVEKLNCNILINKLCINSLDKGRNDQSIEIPQVSKFCVNHAVKREGNDRRINI